MTVTECINKQGLQSEVSSFKRWFSVDVDFLNPNRTSEEVQFDVMFVGTKAGNDELEELFKNYCKENGFSANTVQSVTVVLSADRYDDL